MALTAIRVKNETKPGRYTDGQGLHLHIRANGRKTWVLRFMRAKRLRDMGLGAYPEVSLAQARDAAAVARAHLKVGLDPITERDKAQALRDEPERTFRVAAERFIAAQAPGWRNAQHAYQWAATLASYAYPVFGDRHVQDVDTAGVLEVLRPLWATKTETAVRLRGRIEAVLDAAKSLHWREGENPARWKGHLAMLLPAPAKVRAVVHHPALPWQQVPAFLAALRTRRGGGAPAIEFAILTAARSGEVRGATRAELDLDARVWVVPKARTKAHREHRVPLSSAALAFLARQHVDELQPHELLFPGADGKRMLSDMALTMTVRRMQGEPPTWCDGRTGEPVVVHGFRSTFRDWAGEQTTYPRELIEAALAHVVENRTEAAYARSDLLERRRAVMEEWGRACLPPSSHAEPSLG